MDKKRLLMQIIILAAIKSKWIIMFASMIVIDLVKNALSKLLAV